MKVRAFIIIVSLALVASLVQAEDEEPVAVPKENAEGEEPVDVPKEKDPFEDLIAACITGRGIDIVEDVKNALEKGADINEQHERSGQTPLMAATLRGKINIVKYLLSEGADLTIPERQGYTPAHGAAFQGRPDVMKVLIDAGADVNVKHEDGFFPLHRTCWGKEERHAETLQILLDHGVPHDIKSDEGKVCREISTNKYTLKVLAKHTGVEDFPDFNVNAEL